MSRETHAGAAGRTLDLLRARHARIEERIGELMAERVVVEEKMAEIKRQGHGVTVAILHALKGGQ